MFSTSKKDKAFLTTVLEEDNSALYSINNAPSNCKSSIAQSPFTKLPREVSSIKKTETSLFSTNFKNNFRNTLYQQIPKENVIPYKKISIPINSTLIAHITDYVLNW